MKTKITSLHIFILIFFSCKETKINKSTSTLEIVDVIEANPYIIEIDSAGTIEVESSDIQKLEEMGVINPMDKQKGDAILIELPIPIVLSQETLVRIQEHNYNSTLRFTSSYTFSRPYSLGENRIVIFGHTIFVKGHNEWVCLFEKINGKWQLIKTSTLKEN